jgi:hypothetical protein
MTVITRPVTSKDAQQAHLVTKVSPTGESSRTPARKTLLVRPEWLPESVWPLQTFGLEMDHTTIAVTDVGQGPTLLFVHTGVWSLYLARCHRAPLPRLPMRLFRRPGNGAELEIAGKCDQSGATACASRDGNRHLHSHRREISV